MLNNGIRAKVLAAGLGTAVAGGLVSVPPATAAAPSIRWSPCPQADPWENGLLQGLECARLKVPLDYRRPRGRKITLALSRARHTGPRYQGVVLLNRGGPGAHGRDMPRLFRDAMPSRVAASYDWVGVDPRGVAASEPSLTCDPSYQDPGRARPDTVPRSRAEEAAWRRRAKAFAGDCAAKYRGVLPFIRTAEAARDMDAIRAALGQRKINYFGYSYGTYLGAVYATMFPGRVRRMVLDSVVRPSGVWYGANLGQNVAFEKRIQAWFGWIARHNDAYGLGSRRQDVERAYYRTRAALMESPVNGRIGGTELEETFLANGYDETFWPANAEALADYALRHDSTKLAELWTPPGRMDQNNFAVYSAVQCRDARWPRDWAVWRRDSRRLYRAGNHFETWNNTWYNAPCAYWPVKGGPKPKVGRSAGLPGFLLVQATKDAATPYPGAVEMHRLFPASRLLVQRNGGNHGVTLSGDRCVDRTVVAYLADGSLPPDRAGADKTCLAGPPPSPGADPGARKTGDARVPLNAISVRTS